MKEQAAKLRNFLKSNSIKASVRVHGNSICFARYKYDIEHTEEELLKVFSFAKDNGLTYVRGLPINPLQDSKLTGSVMHSFYK